MKSTSFLWGIIILMVLGVGFNYLRPIVADRFDFSGSKVAFCQLNDLAGSYSAEGAAGTVYGTLKLTNVSASSCRIYGNTYPTTAVEASSITFNRIKPTGPTSLILEPGQTVYSQISYPNGPQCSSGSKTSYMTLSYKFSDRDIVAFPDRTGDVHQNITICNSLSERTVLDVWGLSTQPISGT